MYEGLLQSFFTEGHRLVFWYDAPGLFADALDELSLDGAQILNMAGQSTFGERRTGYVIPPTVKLACYVETLEQKMKPAPLPPKPSALRRN